MRTNDLEIYKNSMNIQEHKIGNYNSLSSYWQKTKE
jgi:hypothetical protein